MKITYGETIALQQKAEEIIDLINEQLTEEN